MTSLEPKKINHLDCEKTGAHPMSIPSLSGLSDALPRRRNPVATDALVFSPEGERIVIDTEAMLGKKTVSVNGKDVAIKPNSGGFDLWNNISHGGVKYFASDKDKGIEPDFRDRDWYLKKLDYNFQNLTTETAQTLIPGPVMHMHEGGDLGMSTPVIFTSSKSSPLAGKIVIGVKLWGFAGMLAASNCIPAYKNAVKVLYPKICDQMAKVAKANSEADEKKEVAVVIRFDGDPFVEKTAPLFTHALFAPFVADEIRTAFVNDRKKPPHIALAITKIDDDKKETRPDLVQKNLIFKFLDGGLEYFTQHFTEYTLRTYVADGHNHCYPGADLYDPTAISFDTGHFDSIVLAIARGKYAPAPAMASEVKNQFLYRILLEKLKFADSVADYCVCVGGNTEGGATSWSKVLAPFDFVVRQNIYAQPAPPKDKDKKKEMPPSPFGAWEPLDRLPSSNREPPGPSPFGGGMGNRDREPPGPSPFGGGMGNRDREPHGGSLFGRPSAQPAPKDKQSDMPLSPFGGGMGY